MPGGCRERIGRKQVLVLGWVVALPIPALVLWAPNWNWIVAATVLLGINQGLTWSMTQTAKLDITRADQRGLVIGLNEFAGYVGVAGAGIITGYLASALGARYGLALFGMVVIVLALVLTLLWVKDTRPWAQAEATRHAAGKMALSPRYPRNISSSALDLGSVHADVLARQAADGGVSGRPGREVRGCAGLGVLSGVSLPARREHQPHRLDCGRLRFRMGRHAALHRKLSDQFGRHRLNVWGMWLCGAGVGLMLAYENGLWWSLCAGLSGFGMALLYPNLSAAVADISHPNWRGSAIGIYRFWRDLGYGIGGLGMGIVASTLGTLESGFWFVALR